MFVCFRFSPEHKSTHPEASSNSMESVLNSACGDVTLNDMVKDLAMYPADIVYTFNILGFLKRGPNNRCVGVATSKVLK